MAQTASHRELADAWLAEDPDPTTAAELRALLAACDAGDAAARDGARRAVHRRARVRHRRPARRPRRRAAADEPRAGAQGLAPASRRTCSPTCPTRASAACVIGHDARHNSRAFAEDTARVLGGAGITSYLAHRPWPTPTTAWAVDRAARVRRRDGHRVAQPARRTTATRSTGATARRSSRRTTRASPPRSPRSAAAISSRCPRSTSCARSGTVIDLTEALHDAYLAEVGRAARAARGRRPVAGRSRTRRCTASARCRSSRRSRAPGFPSVHTEPSQREPDPDVPDRRVPQPRGEGRDGSRARARRARSRPISCSPTIPTPIGCASRSPTAARRLSRAHRRPDRRAARRLPARGRPDGSPDGRDDDRVVAAARLPRRGSRRRLPRDPDRLQVDRQRRDRLRARRTAAGS